MRHSFTILITLLVLSAGCVGTQFSETPSAQPSSTVTGEPATNGTTVSQATQPATPRTNTVFPPGPTPSQDFESAGVPCHDDLWVSFYGLNEPYFWDQDTALVGYSIPPNTSFFAVAYVNGSLSGVDYARNMDADDSVVADGAEIGFDSNVSGVQTVEVVLYGDVNGNQRFDRDTDAPCLTGGTVVGDGPERVNFSRFD